MSASIENGDLKHHSEEPSLTYMEDDKPSSPAGYGSTQIDEATERRLMWKVDLHVVPILFVIYILAFLDRVNIGNAKIQGLMTELHMTGTQYNILLMIFFVPYILLEIPSNLILRKVKPSTWLSGLMFFWGISTMCHGLVHNYAQLVVCRIFLGIFEAGVFPGCAYLIGMYYKRFELQKRLVFFFSGSILAGAFGGLLAFAIIKMNKLGGYGGWRWIFIIEGLATVAISIIAKFLIVDWPETATFLTANEKAMLVDRLRNDGASGVARMDRLDKASTKLILKDWKIWVGVLMYMCLTTTGYSTSFFIPTILNLFGYTPSQSQVHSIPIYIVATVLTLTVAWASDRVRHRYAFAMGGVVLCAVGYIILLCQGPPKGPGALPVGVRYMALFFIVSGVYVVQPIAIVWLTNNVSGHYKRSFGAALQIGLGNLGGIIGSNIYLDKEKPRFKTGYSTGLALLLLSGVLCTVFYFGLMAENKKRDRGERDGRLQLPKAQLENLGDAHPAFRFNG